MHDTASERNAFYEVRKDIGHPANTEMLLSGTEIGEGGYFSSQIGQELHAVVETAAYRTLVLYKCEEGVAGGKARIDSIPVFGARKEVLIYCSSAHVSHD